MDISIVMATWNNCQRLKVTLKAFRECVAPPGVHWELIVVNNNSSDQTDSVVGEFLNQLPVFLVHELQQGLSHARNKGLFSARGKLIIFTDDDIRPCPKLLQVYWEVFQEKRSGFYFGGPIESEFAESAPPQELLEFAPESVKGFNFGIKSRVLPACGPFFLGANWACPAEILKELKGFDPALGLNPKLKRVRTGEETHIMRQLNQRGWKALYIPEAGIRHFVPIQKCTLQHIASRWEAWGYEQSGDYAAYLKYPQIFGIPWGLFKKGLRLRIKWLIAKTTGHKGFNEYIQYRELIGIVDGLRELKEKKR